PSRRQISGASHPANGRIRLLRSAIKRAWLRRLKLHRVRPDTARAGTGRLRTPLTGIGAGLTCYIRDLFLRYAATAGALASRTGVGNACRWCRAIGTWTRLRPRLYGDARQTRGQSLLFERQQV